MVRTYHAAIRKRPRRFHKFTPILSIRNSCDACGGMCNACLDRYQAIVDNERPGHWWRVEDEKIFYKEDEVAEKMLGRKLLPTESVIIRNGDLEDCRPENLEVINIERLETE